MTSLALRRGTVVTAVLTDLDLALRGWLELP